MHRILTLSALLGALALSSSAQACCHKKRADCCTTTVTCTVVAPAPAPAPPACEPAPCGGCHHKVKLFKHRHRHCCKKAEVCPTPVFVRSVAPVVPAGYASPQMRVLGY